MTKIDFVSPIRSHMGYAQMARLIWPALKTHDVRCTDIGMQPATVDLGAAAAEMTAAAGQHNQADFTVANMVPIMWDKMWTTGRRIGYTTFEAAPHPRRWRELFGSTEIIWTTSAYNQRTILADVPGANSHVIRPVADPATPPALPSGGRFTFFSSFQWSARKNPAELIRAFAFAFDGRDDVQLLIKTHHSGGAGAIRREIESALAGLNLTRQPQIKVLPDIVSAAQIAKARAASNAYVSLSHGEGWGLPAWEAMLDARPVLHTAGSAPDEFLPADSLVDSHLVPVYGMERSVSPFFEPGCMWHQPRLDIAIDKMRDIVANYGRWSQTAASAATAARQTYTVDATIAAINRSLV